MLATNSFRVAVGSPSGKREVTFCRMSSGNSVSVIEKLIPMPMMTLEICPVSTLLMASDKIPQTFLPFK